MAGTHTDITSFRYQISQGVDHLKLSIHAVNVLHDLFPSPFYIPTKNLRLEDPGWAGNRHCPIIKQGRIWTVVSGGRVQPQNKSLLSCSPPTGFLGSPKRHLCVQHGELWSKVTPSPLSTTLQLSVDLFTAVLLPRILAKSVQTYSSAAQVHGFEGLVFQEEPCCLLPHCREPSENKLLRFINLWARTTESRLNPSASQEHTFRHTPKCRHSEFCSSFGRWLLFLSILSVLQK